jgi:hypothetical protein
VVRSSITFSRSLSLPLFSASYVYSMMLMTGGDSFPPQKTGMKAFAEREAWPHSPMRIFLAPSRLISSDSALDDPGQPEVAVEEPVVDAVVVPGADRPARAGGGHHRGDAHERVGLEQVVADGREEHVLGALDVERGT